MVDFSAHAIVLSAAGSRTAAGESLTGPVDSLAKLVQLLQWYCARGALAPLGGPGQVWVVGQGGCAPLGLWAEDETQLEAVLDAAAGELAAAGWVPIGRLGAQTLVAKTMVIEGRRQRRLVQIILEPFAPLITKRTEIGLCEDLPADDEDAAAELGRRISWLSDQLGVLPTVAASTTGARMVDLEYRRRRTSGRGAVVDTPGVIEGLDGGGTDAGAGAVGVDEIEPAAHWGREHIEATEIGPNTEVALLDQSAAYLATAGSIELGYGPVGHLTGTALAEVLAGEKLPFGVFWAVLPALGRISVPANMPPPHPLMRRDRDVIAPITTESVRGLCAPVDDGGAGLDIDDLAIDQAWIWESSRRFLEPWAATLRTARLAAIGAGDMVLKTYIGAIYKQYVGRMATDKWADSKMHHYQPIWRAAIIAHCRWRARRQATDIYRKTGLWPIYTYTDSWRYLLAPGVSLAPTLAETREREKAGEVLPLGRLVEEDRYRLTDNQREALLTATSGAEITAVIYPGGAPTTAIPTTTPTPQPPQPLTPAPAPPTATPTDAGRTGADVVSRPPAPATEKITSPPAHERPRRTGKGRRERTYVGDHLEDILAPVSPRAVADLVALVADHTFSYLPEDQSAHTSTLAPATTGAAVPSDARSAPGRRITPYAVAGIAAAVLLVLAIIVVLVVI